MVVQRGWKFKSKISVILQQELKVLGILQLYLRFWSILMIVEQGLIQFWTIWLWIDSFGQSDGADEGSNVSDCEIYHSGESEILNQWS